jgi:hypothetical protein
MLPTEVELTGEREIIRVALVAAFVCRLRARWTRIAVRVAGSSIGAIGLLLAGWALR